MPTLAPGIYISGWLVTKTHRNGAGRLSWGSRVDWRCVSALDVSRLSLRVIVRLDLAARVSNVVSLERCGLNWRGLNWHSQRWIVRPRLSGQLFLVSTVLFKCLLCQIGLLGLVSFFSKAIWSTLLILSAFHLCPQLLSMLKFLL